MSTNRIVRVVVGLALVGYGLYSQNPWFFLGLAPLITGLINWCPLEMKMGTCDPASGCCATTTSSESSSSCCATPSVDATEVAKKANSFSFSATKKGKIEVLGTGCKKCKELEMAATKAVEELGSDYEVVKVEDIQAITNYGVTSTPALVIDGVVKTTGRVLSVAEIKQLIA